MYVDGRYGDWYIYVDGPYSDWYIYVDGPYGDWYIYVDGPYGDWYIENDAHRIAECYVSCRFVMIAWRGDEKCTVRL